MALERKNIYFFCILKVMLIFAFLSYYMTARKFDGNICFQVCDWHRLCL